MRSFLPASTKRILLPLLLGCAGLPLFHAESDPVKRTPDQVLLVINAGSPVSRAVGNSYALQRQVANVLKVRCVDSALGADNETLSLQDYKTSIERPIRAYLAAHPGIDFIVLTKGIPIRIRGGATGNIAAGGGVAQPSLDSYLAALDYAALPGASKYHFTGKETFAANGYAWANRYWNANEPFSHAKFGGYLVTRLDGYTAKDAVSLVSRALIAEQTPPATGALLDVQSDFGMDDIASQPAPFPRTRIAKESPWSFFNTDMAHAAAVLTARGIPVELDLRRRFVGHLHDLAGYYSWGSNDSHFTSTAYESLRFAPGSIGDTAVSTSARTFLPTDGGQSLMADLIAHGLTAAKGYSDEPYLQAVSSPTIVLDRYYSGYTMAESFYMGSHLVGWEDVIVGDPLCAPFLPK